MPINSASVLQQYDAAAVALRALPTDVAGMRQWNEETLLAVNERLADAGRQLGAAVAAVAGELTYRSRPELGSDGLARRSGLRTVENLLKTTTGATTGQVITAVRVGTLLVEAAEDGRVDPATGEIFVSAQPWLRPVAVAVAAGSVSTSAAEAIAGGLGKPNSVATSAQLEHAAFQLVAQAVAGVNADRLHTNARDLRNELDLGGVRVREDEARAARGLSHHPLLAGGGVATWRMDAETYAHFIDTYDRATSPKRGGVRFVDKAKAAQAQSIQDDGRTPTQLASDIFLQLILAGADADDSGLLGSGAPLIRITVADDALTTGVGLARIDGQAAAVSLTTAQRLLCNAETMMMTFDPSGNYVQGHSDARLFSKRQREILAAKFGGCMDPDCERPPSWCEAHHILEWKKDNGRTLVENGILLCKFHHLKYHNDGMRIVIDFAGEYWRMPPACDSNQQPVHMPLKTRNLRDLQLAHQRAVTAGMTTSGSTATRTTATRTAATRITETRITATTTATTRTTATTTSATATSATADIRHDDIRYNGRENAGPENVARG